MSSSELRKGICLLRCKNHDIHGTVLLEETKPRGPVKIKVYINGIQPGKHGFHIHRRGDESHGAHSLCDHFNPTSQDHGDLNSKKSHVGDLGNIVSVPVPVQTREGVIINGIVNTEFIADRVRLSGKNSVFGRSLIVHEDEDDLGKGDYSDSLTTGHSGGRILWGIIGVNDGDQCPSK